MSQTYPGHVVELIGAPSELPVSLAVAKSHLRVDYTDDDALIGLYLAAAVSHLDGLAGILGRAIVSQQWRVSIDGGAMPNSGEWVEFPVLSLISVQSVKYYNTSNVLITASLADYEIVKTASWAYIQPATDKTWPAVFDRADAFQVEFTAGFGDAAAVPAAIKSAILLMVGDMYRNRETVAIGAAANVIPMSATVDRLIAPYRLVGL